MRSRTTLDGRPPLAVVMPVLILLSGILAGVVLWRFLMLDPGPRSRATERLSAQDQRALGRIFERRRSRP